MASKAETILANLKTLIGAIQIGGVTAFVDVTDKLRAPDEVQRRPACDIVLDEDAYLAPLGGSREYRLVVSIQIVQRSDPDVAIGKRIGDLVKAVRDAVWADRTLTQTARSLIERPVHWMYPRAPGSAIGAAMELEYSYVEGNA